MPIGNIEGSGETIRVVCPCHISHPRYHRSQRPYLITRRSVFDISRFDLVPIYHRNHHQPVIPSKGTHDTQTHKTSQRDRHQRHAEEDSSDDGDGFAATADHVCIVEANNRLNGWNKTAGLSHTTKKRPDEKISRKRENQS